MTMILAILLVSTLLVSLLLGQLGKLSMNERILQTVAMTAAAVIFFGLVLLVEAGLHSH